MKKTLIALAAFAAVGSSFAQDSVQVFGVLDVSYSGGNATAANWRGLMSGQWSGSRLGFRGREDLGGGLAAGFWIEAGIDVDSGNGKSTSTDNIVKSEGGLMFNRRSTVSLYTNYGELRLGRDKNPLYDGFNDFEPFKGDTVGAAVMWNAGREQYDNTIATKRVSNSIGYFLPRAGGFYGQLMFAPSEVVTDSPSTNQYKGDGQVTSTYFGYDDKGAFTAGLAYGLTKYSFNVPKNKGGDMTNFSLGATYDFKVVKLWGLYSNDRVGASVAHQELSGDGWSLGVSAPLGTGDLKASYSTYKWDAGLTPKGTAYYVGAPTANKLSLGYFYGMSKRTWLYGVVAKLDRKDGLDAPLNGSVFNSADPGGSSTGFDLGIRHTF